MAFDVIHKFETGATGNLRCKLYSFSRVNCADVACGVLGRHLHAV